MIARTGAAILLAAGAVLPATPAEAAACTSASGVSIVIDFGSSIQTGCASGDPSSAWAAIQAAGFTLEGTQRFPATFICRVNGYPGAAAEACVSTPPATAYWALWHGPAGGSWTYSNSGAASLNPAPGTAIGLAFGAGRTPGMAPPALPKPTTSTTRPQPTQSSTTKGGGTTTSSSSTSRAAGSSTTDPTSTAPSATGSASPRHTGSTSTKSTAGTTSSTSESRTPPAASESSATSVAAPAGADGGNGPSPLAIVGGGALAGAALVAGAIVVRRQRDRARMS